MADNGRDEAQERSVDLSYKFAIDGPSHPFPSVIFAKYDCHDLGGHVTESHVLRDLARLLLDVTRLPLAVPNIPHTP